MPYDEVYLEAGERMEKAVEALRNELRTTRGARASTGLVEHVRVDCYGTVTPLRQIANITTPDPRLIVIRPYDPSLLSAVEKALLKSDLGMAPSNDGKLIRLAVPALSEERRRQIVTKTKQIGEEAKIVIRNVRRDANKQIDREAKQKLLSEDDAYKIKDDIQEMTRQHEGMVDEALDAKTREVMEI